MVILTNESNPDAGLDQSRGVGVFEGEDNDASLDMYRSSTTIVTFGCAAAIALALVGAAYAVDRPDAPEMVAPKGDRVALLAAGEGDHLLVLQDVNVDAGVSNLVGVRTEPRRP